MACPHMDSLSTTPPDTASSNTHSTDAYSADAAWRAYVEAYDIEVPEQAIRNELEYITLEMRHRIQYDRLSGGGLHPFPDQEIAAQEDEIYAAALFEAKEPLVLKAIINEQGFAATPEELENEATQMAERQHSTIEEIKRFFGDDLALLERDVLERKARAWACSQS